MYVVIVIYVFVLLYAILKTSNSKTNFYWKTIRHRKTVTPCGLSCRCILYNCLCDLEIK